jgi:hypothetical protein
MFGVAMCSVLQRTGIVGSVLVVDACCAMSNRSMSALFGFVEPITAHTAMLANGSYDNHDARCLHDSGAFLAATHNHRDAKHDISAQLAPGCDVFPLVFAVSFSALLVAGVEGIGTHTVELA